MSDETRMRHVFITGASTGIGEAIAREFRRRGARLSLVARSEAKLRALAGELGASTFTTPADLEDPAAGVGALERAVAHHGDVDVLVNNAGVQVIEEPESADVERGESLLRVNVFAPLRLIRAALPAMLARGSGSIVNVASVSALAPVGGMLYYNASKGALANASEALALELEPRGVHVFTVYPGPIRTGMGERGIARYEESFATRTTIWGEASELAAKVVRGVERRERRLIYPAAYGVSEWMPRTVRQLAMRVSPKVRADR